MTIYYTGKGDGGKSEMGAKKIAKDDPIMEVLGTLEELNSWPFEFMVNDQSWRDPPFPWKISCLSGEWDYGTIRSFHWPKFIIDVLVFYALIVFLWSAYIALNNKMQRQ